MNEEFALRVVGMTVHYNARPALWDINLSVPKGSFVGIIGPNGAGKSTFIKSILHFLRATSGSAWFFGESFKNIQKKIAYIPQKEMIDWEFPITVLELVLMGFYSKTGLFGRTKKEYIERSREALRLVGIEHLFDRQISQLSGGQQQRAFLARAFVQEAEIYFLDEPFAGVDHASEEVIFSLLKDLQKRGKTIFIVHHDLNSVLRYFDWLILLNVRLIANGPVETAFSKKNIEQAYGTTFELFNETAKWSQDILEGNRVC